MGTHSVQFSNSNENADDHINNKLYMLAHDIKSPVAQVSGLLEIAKSMSNSEELVEILSKAIDSHKRLNHKISQMLDYAINVENENEWIDLSKLVGNVISSVNNKRPGKLRFNVNIENDISYNGNRLILQSILQNLVENAVKYCDPSKKECQVCISLYSKNQELMIEVKDNGIGIPKSKLPLIFQKSYKIGFRKNSHGLGLFLVKKNIENLNGTICVTSKTGEGTTFTLSLPLQPNLSIVK